MSFQSRSKKILELLIDTGSDINARNHELKTPLHYAVEIGAWGTNLENKSDDIFSFLIKRGAIATFSDVRGNTLLHHAANQNNVWAINRLLELGCYVDHVNTHGVTPLHLAALSNSVDALESLLKWGASLDSQVYPSFNAFLDTKHVEQGMSSLSLAMISGSNEAVKSIIDFKIQNIDWETLRNFQNIHGDTLLHYFIYKPDEKYLNKLIRLGCDRSQKNDGGYTPIHIAAVQGDESIMRELIADLDSETLFSLLEEKTLEGKTAWMLANDAKHKELADYLVKKGAVSQKEQASSESLLSQVNHQ